MTQQISYQIENNLYLNITDRCTLVCEFCPKTRGIHQVHDFDLTLDHRPEIDEIIASLPDNLDQFDEIVFCGFGEPTLRLKVLLEVARFIKKRGGQVRINTDGLANLVHKRNVLPEMSECIHALSISLNAQNEAIYNQHCAPQLKGSYSAMLDFLKKAPEYIPDVRASAIDGLEGVDIDACKQIAESCGATFTGRKLDIVG